MVIVAVMVDCSWWLWHQHGGGDGDCGGDCDGNDDNGNTVFSTTVILFFSSSNSSINDSTKWQIMHNLPGIVDCGVAEVRWDDSVVEVMMEPVLLC